MANLIPPEAKKRIKVEYWTRVVSVWLGLLGFGALILVALNVPVYILILNQLSAYTSQFANASTEQTSFEKIETQIVAANNTTALLATAQNVVPLVPLVERLKNLTNTGVTVNSYSLVRTGTVLESIRISGVADDRESLVEFSDRIEGDTTFVSAEIPLSNLAKDKDIPFTVNVVLAKDNS